MNKDHHYSQSKLIKASQFIKWSKCVVIYGMYEITNFSITNKFPFSHEIECTEAQDQSRDPGVEAAGGLEEDRDREQAGPDGKSGEASAAHEAEIKISLLS